VAAATPPSGAEAAAAQAALSQAMPAEATAILGLARAAASHHRSSTVLL
jgi:hypothetical protein